MVGLLAFPYFFFLEMLGPVIEVGGYLSFGISVGLGRASTSFVLAFLSLAVVFGIALSLAAVALEELTFRRYGRWGDVRQLFWLSLVENFGYRQLSTFWRFRGIVSKLRGKTHWGGMQRKGFTTAP